MHEPIWLLTVFMHLDGSYLCVKGKRVKRKIVGLDCEWFRPLFQSDGRVYTNIQACYNGDVAISKVLMEVDVKGPWLRRSLSFLYLKGSNCQKEIEPS